MESTSQLVWGMLFGSFGLGYFVYGKKQNAIIPFITGIALLIAPYLISNVYLLVSAGIVLIALPFFIKP